MTELEQQLEAIQADSIPALVLPSAAWQQFCARHASLFAKATNNHPDKAATHVLLGILTKAHVEETTSLASHLDSIRAMQDVLVENLGAQHAAKFEQQGIEQLLLVSHLWLYLQGYLKMDFSLANDHADTTAQLICSLNKQDSQSLRTQFLASYYHGAERSNLGPSTSSGLLAWLKKLFR